MFEIIKNLPVPEKTVASKMPKRAPKYPFADMEIGDCLAFNAVGKIEEGKFGCWKIVSTKNVKVEEPENKRKRNSTINITKDMLISALESEGTLNGASRILNISSRTFSRLKQKFELV